MNKLVSINRTFCCCSCSVHTDQIFLDPSLKVIKITSNICHFLLDLLKIWGGGTFLKKGWYRCADRRYSDDSHRRTQGAVPPLCCD